MAQGLSLTTRNINTDESTRRPCPSVWWHKAQENRTAHSRSTYLVSGQTSNHKGTNQIPLCYLLMTWPTSQRTLWGMRKKASCMGNRLARERRASPAALWEEPGGAEEVGGPAAGGRAEEGCGGGGLGAVVQPTMERNQKPKQKYCHGRWEAISWELEHPLRRSRQAVSIFPNLSILSSSSATLRNSPDRGRKKLEWKSLSGWASLPWDESVSRVRRWLIVACSRQCFPQLLSRPRQPLSTRMHIILLSIIQVLGVLRASFPKKTLNDS